MSRPRIGTGSTQSLENPGQGSWKELYAWFGTVRLHRDLLLHLWFGVIKTRCPDHRLPEVSMNHLQEQDPLATITGNAGIAVITGGLDVR